MINTPPTSAFFFNGDNIDKLHKEITSAIVKDGNDMTFGYEEKHARDTCMTIQIWGNAVKRLVNGSVPKGFPFSGDKLKEFNRQGIADNPNTFNFVYTYQQLLRKFPVHFEVKYIDQLKNISDKLGKVIQNNVKDNGLVAVLFHPDMFDWKEKPCWNWIQITYLGNNKLSVRLLFRSHDYGTAMWANLSFILYMLRHFVARPNNCEIVEIILFSSSAHIYEGDADNAEAISGIEWSDRAKLPLLVRIMHKLRGFKV